MARALARKMKGNQPIELADWLRVHATQEACDRERWTQVELAKLAGDALGFAVAESTLKDKLDYLKIELVTRRKPKPATESTWAYAIEEYISRVEAESNATRAEVTLLRKSIADLEAKLKKHLEALV